MSLMACSDCGCVYGPTVLICPQCGSGNVGRATVTPAPNGLSRARDAFWVTLNLLSNEPPLVLTNAQRAVIQGALEAALRAGEGNP